MDTGVFLHICMFILGVSGTCEDQKRTSDSLKLKLHINLHVAAGNQPGLS